MKRQGLIKKVTIIYKQVLEQFHFREFLSQIRAGIFFTRAGNEFAFIRMRRLKDFTQFHAPSCDANIKGIDTDISRFPDNRLFTLAAPIPMIVA